MHNVNHALGVIAYVDAHASFCVNACIAHYVCYVGVCMCVSVVKSGSCGRVTGEKMWLRRRVEGRCSK